MEKIEREPFELNAELDGVCDQLVALQCLFDGGNHEMLSDGQVKNVLFAIQKQIERINEEWMMISERLVYQIIEKKGA